MKILYLSACGQIGGAERSLLDMFSSLRAGNPDCSLHLVSSEAGPLVSDSRALSMSAEIVKLPRVLAQLGDAAAGGPAGNRHSRLSLFLNLLVAMPAAISYLRKLRRAIRAFAPDVVHSNGLKMHVLSVLAAPGRARIVWHIHDYVSARPMMARLLKLFSRRCALAIANSESVAADVTRLLGNCFPVQTIYNGVDLSSFSPSGSAVDLDLLASLPQPEPRTIRVGMVGTFARWKGHETFLRAMLLVQSDAPVRGYVIGDALYQTNGSQWSLEELKALAKQIGVSDRVGFAGFVTEAAEAMRSLDIVVNASTEPEPFGLVIAEAMACGKPVIFAEGAGAAEIITPGIHALAHAGGDAASLAYCIALLAGDADLRTRLGIAARATAVRCFDRTRLASALVPLYRSVSRAGCQPAHRQAGSLSYGLES